MSAVLFGGLALGAAVFAFWIYERREIPITGRRILASARAASLALIIALLWNPRLPAFGSGAGAGARDVRPLDPVGRLTEHGRGG